MKKKTEISEGFKAVEFMRKERNRISNEIQGMNFKELQKYFEQRRIHLTNTVLHQVNAVTSYY
jgi:hypothetical protein